MKLLANLFLMAVAIGLGLAVGAVLRRASNSSSTTMASDRLTAQIVSVTNSKTLRLGAGNEPVRIAADNSALVTKLERELASASGITRRLHWIDALQKAELKDLPRLLQLARGDSMAVQLLAVRWIDLNPHDLLDNIVAGFKSGSSVELWELTRTFFEEWTKRDPQAVVAALNDRSGVGPLESCRMTVVEALMEKDPERGLRVMADWHITNFGPSMWAVAKWAAADPRHAAEFTLQHPTGYASREVMETIGQKWGQSDPQHALEFAISQTSQLNTILANNVLKQWTTKNVSDAANWLATVDDKTRQRLSPSFLEQWAKQDVNAALAWCDNNLSGSALAQSVAGLVKGAAEKDVAAAANLVSSLDNSRARSEAAAAVAEKWFPEFNSQKQPKPEAIAWLKTLDGDSIKSVLDRIRFQWADSDPNSMAAFVSSLPEEQVPSRIYDTLARELSQNNPEQALEWASHLPGEAALDAGSAAYANWRRSQPDAATKWLNSLPADDARRDPFFRGVIRGLAYDDQASVQLANLNPGDRATARNVIESMDLKPDQRTRLLDLLK